MSKYSLSSFVNDNLTSDEESEYFELENDYILDIHMDGSVKIKLGSMIAYTGDISFKRESSLSGGLNKFLKKTISQETQTMMDCEGYGHLYVADQGKRINVIYLEEDDIIYVNGNDVLAFESSVEWDIEMLSSGYSAGSNMSHMRLEGEGMIAITSEGKAMVIRVTPDQPVYTDPDATVAWSNGLSINTKTDVNLKTLIGKGSGETFQMEFRGDGFVIIQPFEEVYMTEY